MRHIIIAAGDGQRWGNYTGKPKHLISPTGDGESLIARLCRQLAERGERDVIAMAPRGYADHLTAGVTIVTPTLGDSDTWRGATKFVNTIPHWSEVGRTVIWYGDCWIEDAAVDRIVGDRERRFLHWCRMDGSPTTGCSWGESFAVSFWPENHTDYLRAIGVAVQVHRDGYVTRSGGWEIARVMGGAVDEGIAEHRAYDFYRDIGGGFTEDFDSPADYETWRTNWKNAGRH